MQGVQSKHESGLPLQRMLHNLEAPRLPQELPDPLSCPRTFFATVTFSVSLHPVWVAFPSGLPAPCMPFPLQLPLSSFLLWPLSWPSPSAAQCSSVLLSRTRCCGPLRRPICACRVEWRASRSRSGRPCLLTPLCPSATSTAPQVMFLCWIRTSGRGDPACQVNYVCRQRRRTTRSARATTARPPAVSGSCSWSCVFMA